MSSTLIQQQDWTSAPILDAVENYQGRFIDIDSHRIIAPDEFALSREALIHQLKQQGLESGDRVLLALENGPLFIATLTAVLACDASPLLVHVKTPSGELSRYAQRFGIRFLVTHAPAGSNVDSILVDSSYLEPNEGWELKWGTLKRDNDNVPGPELRGVPLHPTSGSTGLPKIALRPGQAAMEEARHYRETMAIYEEDYIVAIPPMSHAYGYGMSVMVPLLTNASIVTTASFNTKRILEMIQQHPITVLPCVPAHISMMSGGGSVDFGCLRWILAAGSMLPRKAADRFRDRTGVTVSPLYGTTETGGISVSTAANGDDVDGRVGPPMEGVEVYIKSSSDPADGLAPGVGKVHVRSSSMMAGYLDDQGNITLPCEDGWFETGDVARIAEDAVIHLRGRTGEMINVLGLKVVPSEVEEAIAEIPGVREVKVYGRSLKSKAEIVKAAVAVEEGISAADIRAYCEENLVYYKRPNAIAIVDALPRSPAGKIISDQLP